MTIVKSSTLRFFLALHPHPTYALVVLACVLGLGIWTVALSPYELDAGLGMILFIQMFLASSGFAAAARRGHFDALLVEHRNRSAAVAWHWIASSLPGFGAWILLVLTAWALHSPDALSGVIGARMAALFIASAIAWSAGFLMPRGAAGMLWIGALVALMLRHTLLIPPVPDASWAMNLRHAVAILGCPFLLIGAAPGVSNLAVALAALTAAAALICVCFAARTFDVPLRGGA
ncbi:MAG TPA: hypothetical protein VGL62_02075 [Vicinamibacterales bacterium]|jgi:hypothetical protein